MYLLFYTQYNIIKTSYLSIKSLATVSNSGTAALAASGAISAFETLDLNFDHGSPCLPKHKMFSV